MCFWGFFLPRKSQKKDLRIRLLIGKCAFLFWNGSFKYWLKEQWWRTNVLSYPFPLQPLLLLLLEVFLPLQALLLRLLSGFSLSLFFLKHTGENPTTVLMPAGGGTKTWAKMTCLLRNKGVVAPCNYCLQPQKGYFPAPKESIFNIYSLVIQSKIQYLSLCIIILDHVWPQMPLLWKTTRGWQSSGYQTMSKNKGQSW